MMKAVRHHTDLKWIHLYVQRWLTAPVQREDGTLEERTAGTPQGGVISPLLANLFMHYAFDDWSCTRRKQRSSTARTIGAGASSASTSTTSLGTPSGQEGLGDRADRPLWAFCPP